MSNRVIAMRNNKGNLDALEIQCQGTKEIKKNMRAILIQEYEYFEAKSDESLTDVYDRFLTLLNELALVGQMYPNEFSNTKFLRSLHEEWDVQTSIIRYGMISKQCHLMNCMCWVPCMYKQRKNA